MRSRVWLYVLGVAFGLWTSGVYTQDVPEIKDNFEEDPVDLGWILNGAAIWVPPDVPECVDANNPDPFDPCTLYTDDIKDNLPGGAEGFGGYILVTPGQNNQGGNAFFSEPTLFENFTMEVVIELRDGSIGRPADGMTIVLLGSADPPASVGALGAAAWGRPGSATCRR